MKAALLSFLFLFSTLALVAQSNSDDIFKKLRSKKGDEIHVFPNPASSYIGIANADRPVSTIIVFNLVGREMKRFDAESGEKYYVGDLPEGMYLIQLLDERNKIMITQRVNKR